MRTCGRLFFLQANVDIFQSNTVFTLRAVLKEQAARVGILLIVGVHPLKEPGYYKTQKYSFDHRGRTDARCGRVVGLEVD
jgi:hypothetical protein